MPEKEEAKMEEVKEVSVEKIDEGKISVNTSTSVSVEHDIEAVKAKLARLISDRDENLAIINKEIAELEDIINKASQVGVV